MNALVIFIIVSTAFIKGGAFLSLPFLTVYLMKHLQTTPALTGFVVGLNPLASMLVGFYGGYLSDIWGRKKILLFSALIAGASYLCFSISTEVWHFALFNLLLGAAAGSLQSALTALLGDLTVTPEKKFKAFRLQYFAINVGASIGPLVGAALLVKNSHFGFIITGSLYLLFAACFLIFDGLVRTPLPAHDPLRAATPSFSECVQILKNDAPFLLFVFGSLLMSLTYSQIDTLLPQHLRIMMGDEGIKVFGKLLAVNSVTVLLGLYPAIWISDKFGALRSIFIGQILMSVGFAAMAFAGASVPLLFSFMLLLTVGEILSFSNWSIVIDGFARPGLRGAYFGASGFALLGNTLGPTIGGFFFQNLGPRIAFSLLGFVSSLGVAAYLLAERKRIDRLQLVESPI